MEEQDIAEVVQIISAHHPFDGESAARYFHAYFRDSRRTATCDEENYVLVERGSGTVLGVSGHVPDQYKTPGVYWLSWTYVHEKHRRRGYGSALLQYTIEQVKAMGARKLYIDTSSDIKYNPAIRLYQRFGFQIEASLADYYGHSEDYVILGITVSEPDQPGSDPTPAELDIRELTDPDSELARQAFALYEEAFPVEERDPVKNIVNAMRQRQAKDPTLDRLGHFWIVLHEGAVAGLAMFTYYRADQLAFIAYMAIRRDLRGQGYGSALFQRLVERLPIDSEQLGGDRADALGACFEVERPDVDGLDDSERRTRERRIRFYQRNGAQILREVDFVAPPLAEDLPPVPYYLMFRPVDASRTVLTRSLQHVIVKTVLLQVYRLQPQDPEFQDALASLQTSKQP
jgi:GNAT superfamily N-acetyltransferase